MSGYLLDTNVISILSPSSGEGSSEFEHWLERADGEGRIFLSVVSIHEIAKGITKLESKGASTKASGLELWLEGLLSTFEEKILPLDISSASASGRLEALAIAAGDAPGVADAMIAGTAKLHDLTVVTRNAKHFRPFNIAVLSPEAAARTT